MGGVSDGPFVGSPCEYTDDDGECGADGKYYPGLDGYYCPRHYGRITNEIMRCQEQ